MKKKKTQIMQSKTPGFLESIRKDNSMIEYITSLRIMNPAANFQNDSRREGSFTRLAHAKEEFRLPVFSKGKTAPVRKKS